MIYSTYFSSICFSIYLLIFLLLALYTVFVILSKKWIADDSADKLARRVFYVATATLGTVIHLVAFSLALLRGASPEETLLFLMISSALGVLAMRLASGDKKNK